MNHAPKRSLLVFNRCARQVLELRDSFYFLTSHRLWQYHQMGLTLRHHTWLILQILVPLLDLFPDNHTEADPHSVTWLQLWLFFLLLYCLVAIVCCTSWVQFQLVASTSVNLTWRWRLAPFSMLMVIL